MYLQMSIQSQTIKKRRKTGPMLLQYRQVKNAKLLHESPMINDVVVVMMKMMTMIMGIFSSRFWFSLLN